MRLLLLASPLLLSACLFVFPGDDEPPVCQVDEAPIAPYRNPNTLACESLGGGGGGCYPSSGAAPQAFPSWPLCGHPCDSLDEGSCIGTPGCRAAYDHACVTGQGNCTSLQPFLGCYPVDTSGPIAGSCLGLDAFECSQHDDCGALYRQERGGLSFAECAPERGRPWGTCRGDVRCDLAPPVCPVGSTPGIANGCYTGVCIPLERCEEPRPCESARNEAECTANNACTPLYIGHDCTCTPTSCTCQSREYFACANAQGTPTPR